VTQTQTYRNPETNHGHKRELKVIALTVEAETEHANESNADVVSVYSDSQTALKTLRSKWSIFDRARVKRILDATEALANRGTIARFRWIPEHSGIAGHEKADREAERACHQKCQHEHTVNSEAVVQVIRRQFEAQWQTK
jgi:ribonuclease HI